MSVESAEDRRSFLADFGVLIDWKVGATTTLEIPALFDTGTVQQEFSEGVSVLNRRATLTMIEDDLPTSAGAPADEITIDGVVYHPKALQPDGQGMVVITLEKDL